MNHSFFRISFSILLFQFWLLPPFLTIQFSPQPGKHAMRAWMRKYNNRLEYTRHPPFVRVVTEERDTYRRAIYPVRERKLSTEQEPIRRMRKWEAWPGAGWGDVQKKYYNNASKITITQGFGMSLFALALLAGIPAAALAIPGIETAHWLARAFFVSGTALAVCGVIVGTLGGGIFDIFFEEDINACAHANDPHHRFLTLEASPQLCHRIVTLHNWPRGAITVSSVLFLGGMLAFIATATFDGTVRPPKGASLIAFRVLSVLPSVLYMTQFFRLLVECSFAHRRFRDESKKREEGRLVEGDIP
ncbi:hypothetical protein B0H16DRAFT_1768663 [Mycena metata]|uniref:Transmembrane protein n=1 Tax=Mycena metata TaxID=1033252 RepID=A0AAD7I216_9AGAR|nr:hypothetical protein B0H16DRAFT_1768663 [Mycena metata]